MLRSPRPAALLLAAGLAGAAAGTAGPASAATGDTGAWVIREGAAKGLVTVSQAAGGSTLAFNLFGLTPNHRYRLVASSKGCAATSGTLFRRAFTTDTRGRSWDPVLMPVDASRIRSMAVRDRASGATVACTARPTVQVGPENPSAKVDAPRGVVMISEANALWQLIESFSGLRPDTRYRSEARPGGCAAGGAALISHSFRSNAKGDALVQAERSPVAGKDIGSVRLVVASTGKTVFCRTMS